MQSIGERLEEARKRKGISIREAAEATKIRGDYLHKFESNQYDIKLPEIYVRGFLRTYANYLKLPGEKIINDYNGLGLAETKQRAINREVYGRMDISHSSAKGDKAGKDPAADSTPSDSSSAGENATRNPATFVPQGGSAISIDKKLLIKFGALLGVAVIVLVALIWLIVGGKSSSHSSTSTTASSPAETWVKPQGGEPSLTLVGSGRANVTATQYDGTVLYQGVIPAGDTRAIPRRGKEIDVLVDIPANLKLRIDNKSYDMPGTSAKIDAGKR